MHDNNNLLSLKLSSCLKMKIRKQRILALVVAGLIMAGGATVHAGSNSTEKNAPTASRPALTVRTTTLREDKWARTMAANGSIIPWQEAIISAQLQGLRIAEVRVSIGDWVRQGDLLVTLDNVSRDGSELGASTVQGRIVAPDSGVISAASATVGSMPKSGDELFKLIRKGRLEWRANLTADELMLIRKGMTAEIAVGEGRVIKGTVRAISPSVDLQTRYGHALVTLPDSRGIIAGAFARGVFDVSTGKRTVQTLPQTAVMQRGSKTYVLIVGPDHRVRDRAVAVGQRQGDRVQIKDGLKADEPVVESGGAFLTEGDAVLVVKD